MTNLHVYPHGEGTHEQANVIYRADLIAYLKVKAKAYGSNYEAREAIEALIVEISDLHEPKP